MGFIRRDHTHMQVEQYVYFSFYKSIQLDDFVGIIESE